MKSTIVALCLLTSARGLALAQDESLRQCAAGLASDAERRYCNANVQAIEITQARVGIAAAGGNPVPGTSSTLGMRLGTVPRLSLGARVTVVKLELPAIDRISSTNEIDQLMSAIHFDGSVGLFSGFSILPTVGGFGSIDLVTSLGRVSLPDEDNFPSNVTTWGIGARLGILRESFTAPGVSITGMYRGFSPIRFKEDPDSDATDANFELSGSRLLSVRGVIGKRLLFLSALAGVGYDRMSSDVSLASNYPTFMGGFAVREDGFETTRTTVFGSAQWTLLILTLVGEAGWQSGGDTFTAPLPAGQRSMTQQKPFFGSIALRLSI
jgi:hypothetical protein